MITARDLQAINYIQEYRCARTSTLAELFYPSYRVAARRLLQICDIGELKRTRDIVSSEYAYYIKPPKQLRHSLYVTDLHRELSKIVEVKQFICEPSLGKIRPDAVVGYMKDGKAHIALIEIELSNKGFDYAKYHNFAWKNYFSIQPELFVVSEKPVSQTGLKTHLIGLDLKLNI